MLSLKYLQKDYCKDGGKMLIHAGCVAEMSLVLGVSIVKNSEKGN